MQLTTTNRLLTVFISILICFVSCGIHAQHSIYKVQDNTPSSSYIQFGFEQGFEYDDMFYFRGPLRDAQADGFLQYDGSAVEVFNPNGNCISFLRNHTIFQDKLVFSAIVSLGNSNVGIELYSYDGQDVSLIKDINPNGDGFEFGAADFVEFQNKLYFSATDGTNGSEIWIYDGVSVTQFDLLSGPAGSSPQNFTVLGDKLFFTAEGDNTSGKELWYTDGLQYQRAADIWEGTGSSNPANLTVAGDYLYFTASDSIHGRELWSYKTTVTMVEDVNPGISSSNPNEFVEHQGDLYISAYDTIVGKEVRRVQGNTLSLVEDLSDNSSTFSGSYPVASFDNSLLISSYFEDRTTSIYSYKNGISTFVGQSIMFEPIEYEDKLYFRGSNTNNGYELFSYDGTTMSLAIDIDPGRVSSFPRQPAVYRDEMIWFVNGTFIQTNGVSFSSSSISHTGVGSSIGTSISSRDENFMILEDSLLFVAAFDDNDEGLSIATIGKEGMKSSHFNGLIPDSLSIASTYRFFTYQNSLYLYTTSSSQRYLSSIDLATKTFSVGLEITQRLSNPTLYNGKVYFLLRNEVPGTGTELYEFDGNQITLIEDFRQGSRSGVDFSNMVVYRDNMYFICVNDGIGFELCRFNGSTIQVVHTFTWNVNAIRFHFNESLIVYNDKLYMPGYNNRAGEELFVYNGSFVSQVVDLNGTNYSGNPNDFHVFDNDLYFIAHQGGEEFIDALYKYDGSMVTIISTTDQFVDNILGVYDNRLLCSVTTTEAGNELWWYDGTTLSLAKDIAVGCEGSSPLDGIEYNGKYYFIANDGLNGHELYVIDPDDCPDHFSVQYPIDSNEKFEANYNIQLLSTASLPDGNTLTASAKRSIQVYRGFTAEGGSELIIDNIGCQN